MPQLNSAEPPPPAPEHLSPRAAAIWRSLVPSKIAHPSRCALLQAGLEDLDLADRLTALVRDAGPIVTSSSGGLAHVHPALKAMKDSKASYARIMAALGADNWILEKRPA